MKRTTITCSILVFSLFSIFWVFSRPAAAATNIIVTTTDDVVGDDELCSLREAIIAANNDTPFHDCDGGTGDDTILFDPALPKPATFTLAIGGKDEDLGETGDLDISGVLTITGDGLSDTIFDGDSVDRFLHIHPLARITISGVTVTNGNPGDGANGGGAAVELTGRLTLENSAVTDNTAALGGGAYSLGGLTMNDSTVSLNKGGGLHNSAGLLTLNNVDILNNSGGYGITNKATGFLEYTTGKVSENVGGGIQNDNATAELSGLIIDLNTVGGGLHNKGLSKSSLSVANSSINNNAGPSGAGLFNEGNLAKATIENSQINNNKATGGGGGISNNGDVTVTNSTIDHNDARSGGGIDNQGISFKATNVTISSNTANDNGGGLANRTTATLTNVTISGNSASGDETGGNVFNDDGSLEFVNSIVANPGAGGNCDGTGTLTSLGHNLESTDTCGFGTTGDVVGTDPKLGLLQDNGGPTPTHALLSGSPAIDQGNNTLCPGADQRGVVRSLDGDADSTATCDKGAFEAGAMVCGVEASAPIAFDGLILTVTDLGNVTCVRVTNLPYDAPDATTGIQTGQYWNIAGLQSAEGPAATPNMFNLTLPHTVTPNSNATVCKYPGGLGGAGWDCARTESTPSTVRRDEIASGFSTWAVGDSVSPTALTLNSFSASSATGQTGLATILLGAFVALTFAFRLWHQRQSE